ncbi:metallophosphoesterase [Paenibacillus sp. HJGM_3]|uniref:metallophosphoesterase n=1 Tax=Paenibacillus sp. HJGM_3 TaxID=3379816 RepID=UPI00385E2A07
MKRIRTKLTVALLSSSLLASNFAGYTQTYAADPVQPAAISLSVKDQEMLVGSRLIKGITNNAADQSTLAIDGVPVPGDQFVDIQPELLMDINGFDSGFKNGILIGDQIVKVIDAKIVNYETVRVPIPTSMLQTGANTISLHSGNNLAPTGTAGNNDDFSVQNVRLVLGNGTVLPVEGVQVKTGSGSTITLNPTSRVSLGDGLPPNDQTAKQSADFTFTVPQKNFTAKQYMWDTTKTTEGMHSIVLKAQGPDGEKQATANVLVDNAAPVFESISPVEGKTYKGNIDFQVKAVDATSGIDTVEAKLDGKPIQLPSTIAGVELTPGAHTFEVSATDKAGNKQNAAVSFSVVEEHPYRPVNPTPADSEDEASQNPKLSVLVSDPTNDPLDVTFLQGYRTDLKDKVANKAFVNSTDREPPLEMIPAGEKEFSPDAYTAVEAKDGKYLTTDSKEKFPYHRFDLKLEQDLAGVQEVEVVWEGHSLPDRQVTLYTWNFNTNKWVAGAAGTGDKDFTLKSKVNVQDMVKDNLVHVLIQDMIPSPDQYDFTFAWITDTQYYSESYPHIYDTMNQYIVENRDKLKIDYTIHTGDIVDDWNQPQQWANANKSMKILDDAKMPYGVVAGNHDVNFEKADYAEYYKYFGRDRFISQPTYGGDLENNRDHYDLVSSKGNDFIILYLGWSIDQQTIDWANDVLKRYPDRNAIVATHEYISPSGQYSGQGRAIWDNIVAGNQNVFMVLCGHHHGVAYNVKHATDGRTVIELLHDYQAGPEGGQGYLRLLHFDTENKQLIVNTYSPYMKDYNFFEDNKDEFTLPLNLKPVEKQVATDYIAVNVYGKEVIGQDAGVKSGTVAKTHWQGLGKGGTHFWYVRLADQYGGRQRSDIWSFTTKASQGLEPPKGDPELIPHGAPPQSGM